MRKLLSALVLLVAVSSAYAEKGEFSYIPKVKVGASKIDLDYGGYSYSETEPTYGAGIDILYGFTENFEGGIGVSLERNYIAKGFADYIGESEDTRFGQLFITGRYNFRSSSELTPFVQAKVGVAKGGETFYSTGTIDYVPGSARLEIDPTLVYGISTGVEYRNFNLELGYEIIKVDLDLEVKEQAGKRRKLSATEEEDIKTIYLALGYRF